MAAVRTEETTVTGPKNFKHAKEGEILLLTSRFLYKNFLYKNIYNFYKQKLYFLSNCFCQYKRYIFHIFFFAGILTKIFTMIDEVKFEISTLRKNQQEIKRTIYALLTANDNININKFSRALPITSIEAFNEIDDSLANSQEDFVSLVKI